jgi:small conductance mechanosensitive channel
MNGWRVIIPTVLVILLETLLLTGYCSQAVAQNASETGSDNGVVSELPPDQVGERANELLSRINGAVEAVERYERALAGANGEDRLVLQLQMFSLRKRILDDIHQLADELLQMEKAGQQPELRKQVVSIFPRVTPLLWFHIQRLRGEIDAVRARRLEAAAEERSAIEDEVTKFTTRLDAMYEMSLAHIRKMEQVGMDIKKARADFTKMLTDRADELSGRLELALDRIDDLEARRKEIPDDANVAKLLIARNKNLNTNAASMEVVLRLMDTLELDTEAYRAQLMTATRDISSGLLNTGVAVRLMSRTMKRVTNWLVDRGPQYLVKLLMFFGILFVFRFATRIVRAGLEKALDASNLNLSQLARRMIVTSASNLLMFFGILVALSQLGISLGPLLAGLGVAGFIVGFALQDTLGNFASGMMILLYRPYDMGDMVDVAGVFGKVDKMSLVSTSILTLDNQTIVIPNSKIWGDVIKNVTAQDIRRVDMVFGISYGDDIPKAESILNDILKSHDKVLDDPEPMVRVHALGESSVDFIVRPWVKVDDYWEAYWDVTRTVKLRFDEEGISIPFPQTDVHVYNEHILTAGAE